MKQGLFMLFSSTFVADKAAVLLTFHYSMVVDQHFHADL